MDITADKFVAAFFATTEVLDGGEYVPIVDNRDTKGVFYRCQDPGLLMPIGRMSKLRAVGLQPFSRPGEQAGLVYEMSEGDFYFDKSDEFLNSYLKNQGVIISDEVDFSFTADEKNQFVKDWCEGGEKELLSKIIVRPVYTGDDLPIYGRETLFKK